MAGFKAKGAPLHSAFSPNPIRVVGRVGWGAPVGVGVENDTDFVGEYFFRSAHAVEGVSVDHLVQLGYQEQIREYRELHDERLDLRFALLAAPEPGGIGIRSDDAVPQQFA